MKKLLLLIFIGLAACSGNESFIEGQLPNVNYDNEVVYLVPFKGATKKTVDSTVIRESHFQFKIKPKKQNQIFIIRVKPLLRLKLQDILVITEPGTVFVNYNANSSASGTPLNLTLQQWKEGKQVFDSTFYSFRQKYREETDEAKKALIQSEINEIYQKNRAFTDSLIEANKDNPVGQLIRSLEKGDK